MNALKKQKFQEVLKIDLYVNIICVTPIVNQIQGAANESAGIAFEYRGYWKNWDNFEAAGDVGGACRSDSL